MPTSLTRSLALLCLIGLANACAPSCETVCRKVIRCELADNYGELECEDACARQIAEYDVSERKDLDAAFDQHRRCIGSSSCEELEDGVCYDAELFPF